MSGWLARSDRWIGAYLVKGLRILLGLQVFALVFFIAGTHGAFAPQPKPPTTTDFASFYAAGRLADAGRPASAYDPVAHRAAEQAVIAPGVDEKRFLNPPVFLLLCAPLAKLPYLAAFVLFEAATSLSWLVLTTRIAGGGRRAAACLAAIPAVWWALGWGQNTFLSAGLLAVGTWLVRRNPLLAGMAFGALCFKPHFGLLVPVALVAGRHWRAILGAALSVLLLTATSAAWFGLATWRAFLAMAGNARSTVESGIALAAHVDLAGAARLAGMQAGWSWMLQGVVGLCVAACVAWAWQPRRAAVRPEAANAVLIAGTLTAMPFLLFYDLAVAGVAAAWLTRAARAPSGAWLRGEPAGLLLCFSLSLLAYPAALLLGVDPGVAAAPALLILALRRCAAPGPQ